MIWKDAEDGLEFEMDNLILEFDNIILQFKVFMGNYIEKLLKEEIFGNEGEATFDTDPLNPRGVNPKWAELAESTIRKKGSSRILIDEHQLFNTISWRIEDSFLATDGLSQLDEEAKKDVVKVGWFEDSGGYNEGDRYLSTAHLAAIHEYGLTGTVYRTPDGHVMGGAFTRDRNPEENEEIMIQNADLAGSGLMIKSRVIIPERSMLRKTADLFALKLDKLFDKFFRLKLEQLSRV